MLSRQVADTFEKWQTSHEALALVIVTDTKGSTYSKPGNCMLINGDLEYAGLISGGCLEADIVEHARQVLNDGEPRVVHYDLAKPGDELWGPGLGCDGEITLLILRLTSETAWEPMPAMVHFARHGMEPVVTFCVRSEIPELPVGACLCMDEHTESAWQLNPDFRPVLRDATREFDTHPTIKVGSQSADLLRVSLPVLPRLLILGAGPDVMPLVDSAEAAGWYVTVADHREALLTKIGGDAEQRLLAEPAHLADELTPGRFAAAVVMSHHLEADRDYLGALADSDVPVIGLLGPKARRNRLLNELGDKADSLAGRLHSPVGLDLGGNGPEAIALSIMAQMQSLRWR